MEAMRQIYERLPDTLTTPENLRQRRVEVILIALDETAETRGWPLGFFETTYGSLPELPEREPQGEFETREPLE
jgi:hypothetical protein